MYRISSSRRPPVGTIIARWKFPLIHRGIYVGSVGGTDQVFESTIGHGARLIPFVIFAHGQKVWVEGNSRLSRHALLARVRRELGGKRWYNLITNNCDHAVTRVAHGRPVSRQLWGYMAAAAVLGLLTVRSRRA